MIILFVLIFVDFKNIRQLMHFGYETKLNYGKHVLYDFLKNDWVAWGKILTHFSRQFLKITKSKGDSTDISSPKGILGKDKGKRNLENVNQFRLRPYLHQCNGRTSYLLEH